MATARRIGHDMGPGLYDVNGLTGGAKLDHGLVVDLALSMDAAVMWWMDFATDTLTWMPGLDEMLGMAGASDEMIRAQLSELVSPLTVAARSAAVWQDFTLEQPFETPTGKLRWLQFRARTSAGTRSSKGAKGLLGIATDVTDRHEHQQALSDLADRYRLLVELSPEAVAVHQDGQVVYVNPATVRFLRAHSAAAILGRPITDFVHPDSAPEMLHRIDALAAPGAASPPAEAILQRVDGDTMNIESVSVRTTWEGQPAFQVIMRDITTQRAAAAALRYQAALVTHVSDALIATTADGTVTSWNPAAETVYGHSAEDAIGQQVQQVVGARLDPEAVLAAGGVLQAVHRHADGTPLAIRVSAAQMDTGYVLVCADETEKRRAEQHFTTVVAALEEGVVVVGPTGLVESANPAAERILGVREREVLGAPSELAELYDETGARIDAADFPAAHTSRTGLPQNGRILRVKRQDGSHIWLSLSCRSVTPDSDLPRAVVVSFTDITERRLMDARLEHDATHDALTELANRTVAINRLSPAARNRRSGLTAVLFIDLDKFKVINDSLGHTVGDRVLQIMGSRLSHEVRRGDLVGRLGGDEFAVIVHGVSGADDAGARAEQLRHALSRPVVVDGRHLHIDASIGIVITDRDDPRAGEDILRDADLAMYQAKTQGRGRHAFFDVELRERTQRRLQLEQDLRHAPRQGQLWLAYQPIMDLRTGSTMAMEGLLRWTHPRYGAISPGEFIPLAEESDLINLVGDYMLHTATEEAVALRAKDYPDLRLAVNLSTRQLDDPLLVRGVRDTLSVSGLPAGALCMEITESALMRDPDAAARTLDALRELGVRLAIDDFGTGYSSLAQLLRLPVDTLKIDQSFTAGLGESKDAEAIVTSTIAMAHAVDLTVVAEGVENTQQLDILRELDCDQAQGYLLGRPTAAKNL
ncbi:MAG TPA: EAL domain-containing protein [Pseudonocardiaceae bacterium]|jgi:diguanylate cyclase (GGDEF)-like protein/PAS domain S-box-containing protein|nr:EAL domain-containing protein [Pseudonocardiaceae bacterium]